MHQLQRKSSDQGRVFPSGVRVDTVPYGLGVFAFAFIPKETPIGRVSGKIITESGYGSDYCISAGEDKVLEPGPPFCYLNHSCEPNCQLMQYVREEEQAEEDLEIGALSTDELDFEDEPERCSVDSEPMEEDDDCFFGDGAAAERYADEEDETGANAIDPDESEEEDEMLFEDDSDAEIWVESIRDILPGEELTIDYAWPADRGAKCLCGSPNCRGWIVDPDEMDELQELLKKVKVDIP